MTAQNTLSLTNHVSYYPQAVAIVHKFSLKARHFVTFKFCPLASCHLDAVYWFLVSN